MGEKTVVFSNCYLLGPLFYDKILIEEDCPMFFTCRDANNNEYMCAYCTKSKCPKWLMMKMKKDYHDILPRTTEEFKMVVSKCKNSDFFILSNEKLGLSLRKIHENIDAQMISL